ncbi:MAG: hypothetical protein CM1200mP2_34040 [Planctomycetaceae bacterium]|nr:MAG: hypothetical protein CM1200mP2_34040 [Planctomycetaceae bacterium]
MLACARIGAVTRSSSEDSVPTRWPRETTTPRPSWSSPPTPVETWQGTAAEGSCGQEPREVSHGRKGRGRQTDRLRRRDGAGSGLLVARVDGRGFDRCEATPLDSEHPLFILYTSGSTGKPKGVLHTTAGYLLGTTMTSRLGLRPQGRRHLLVHRRHRLDHRPQLHRLGAAGNGATTVMYKGAPNWPDEGRFWQIVQKYGVSSSTPLPPRSAPSSSGATTGPDRPISRASGFSARSGTDQSRGMDVVPPGVWGREVPIVDTWWQTETGGIMLSPLPGVTATNRAVHQPLARGGARHVTKEGESLGDNRGGLLVMRSPGRRCSGRSTETTTVPGDLFQ